MHHYFSFHGFHKSYVVSIFLKYFTDSTNISQFRSGSPLVQLLQRPHGVLSNAVGDLFGLNVIVVAIISQF